MASEFVLRSISSISTFGKVNRRRRTKRGHQLKRRTLSATWGISCLTVLLLVGMASSLAAPQTECVVLLHGLARTSASMQPLARALSEAGYEVVNLDYASRQKPIEELAPLVIEAALGACASNQSEVHFVTHSLGGILVRYYMAHNELPRLGRVVMLAPPNQGSEVVDELRNFPGFEALHGPAGLQLGTDPDSIPRSLGAVSFELGVIAGNATVNPLLSLNLPNPDDGKVSVASTKVEGMADFLEVPHSHTFIMRSEKVIAQVLAFLATGRFDREAPTPATWPAKVR